MQSNFQRILATASTAFVLAVPAAHAALVDRGGGLIYDTTLNITWLQNANGAAGTIYDDGWSGADGRMSFANAQAWVSQFVYHVPTLNVDVSGWRLPHGYDFGAPGAPVAPPFSGPGCDYSNNGDDCGFNMDPRSAELVHLFYVDLGNIAEFDTFGNDRPGVSGVNWGGVNVGPFKNVDDYMYWSVIVNPVDSTQVWRHFKFYDGRMSWRLDEPADMEAWAVHDGDVAASFAVADPIAAVPEPDTYVMLLVGLGLLGLAARRRSRRCS